MLKKFLCLVGLHKWAYNRYWGAEQCFHCQEFRKPLWEDL